MAEVFIDESQEEQGRWYAVRTFTGHEEKVRDTIEREAKNLGLEDRIFEAVVPKENVIEVRNGKKRTREKNFLPGYMLVRCKMDIKVKDVISNLPSIVSFVGRRGEPEPLQKLEIERIFGRVEERKDIATVETKFQVGDPVKVIDGPFNTFNGAVMEVNEEKQKLKVEVQILGRKTPVELDFTQVEVSFGKES